MSDTEVINILMDAEFQHLNNLQKQIYWSSIFLSGFKINQPSSGYDIYGDPRYDVNSDDKINREFVEYASSKNVSQYYLYLNDSNNWNHTTIIDASTTISRLLLSYSTLTESEVNTIVNLVAGAKYFDKWKSDVTTNACLIIDKSNNETITSCVGLKDQLASISYWSEFESTHNTDINNRIKDIELANFGKSQSVFNNTNGYIISTTNSYADDTLIREYNETKDKYNDYILKLFDSVSSSTGATICISNSTIGNIDLEGNESINYINIDQTIACNGAVQNDLTDINTRLDAIDQEIMNYNIQVNDLNEHMDELDKITTTFTGHTMIIELIVIIIILVLGIVVFKLMSINKSHDKPIEFSYPIE